MRFVRFVQKGAVGTGLIMMLGTLVGCHDAGCINAIGFRVSSPGARYDAIVFSRDCGATTAPITEISLVDHSGALPDGPGNILATRDEFPVAVAWIGADSLVVSKDAHARVISQETSWRSVKIAYLSAP